MKKNILIVCLFILNIIFGFIVYKQYITNNILNLENINFKKNISILNENITKLTPSSKIVLNNDGKEICSEKLVEYTVRGNSMYPLIKDGDKIKVKENYYKCNGIMTRGDIVIYESNSTNGPIVKQIRALPGDIIKFENNKIIINTAIMKNSSGEEYLFSDIELRMLKLYVRDDKLQDNAFFAFGDNTKESLDSRKLGGLGINGFIGKVVDISK